MAEGAEDVPVIYLHEIKRQYRQGEATLTILNGAKLALWPGQSVALVAPSGSGKSTLLHIAGLLETPDDGEVYVAGAPTSQLSDIDRTRIRRSDIGCHRPAPVAAEFTLEASLPQMIRPQTARAISARPKSWPISASPSASRIGRPNCPAANSSGWRSRARWRTRRGRYWQTSRPETSIRIPPITCSVR
jgi:energy-coupling factor transporter ATP-binding protein EcfA2